MERIYSIFLLIICAFSTSVVFSIHVPNDGVKTRTFRPETQVSEAVRAKPVEMHHQYSQVASNRPGSEYTRQYNQGSDVTRSYQGSSAAYQSNQGSDDRESRSFYSYGLENSITPYHSECPPGSTGQFPYLYDCRRFLNCWKGRGYIQSCAPGTIFNPETLECDNPKKVICHGLGNSAKPQGTNEPFERLQTVTTRHQSAVPRSIVTASTTTTGEVKCTPGITGIEPHPYECNKFLNCAHGITHVQSCGPGTAFDALMGVCDFAHKVKCGSRSIATNSGVTAGTTHYIVRRPVGNVTQTGITTNQQYGIQRHPKTNDRDRNSQQTDSQSYYTQHTQGVGQDYIYASSQSGQLHQAGGGSSASIPNPYYEGQQGSYEYQNPQQRPPGHHVPPGHQIPLGNQVPPGHQIPLGHQVPPGHQIPPGHQVPPGHQYPPGYHHPPGNQHHHGHPPGHHHHHHHGEKCNWTHTQGYPNQPTWTQSTVVTQPQPSTPESGIYVHTQYPNSVWRPTQQWPYQTTETTSFHIFGVPSSDSLNTRQFDNTQQQQGSVWNLGAQIPSTGNNQETVQTFESVPQPNQDRQLQGWASSSHTSWNEGTQMNVPVFQPTNRGQIQPQGSNGYGSTYEESGQRNIPVYEPTSQRGHEESGQRNVPVYEPNSHRGQGVIGHRNMPVYEPSSQRGQEESGQRNVPVYESSSQRGQVESGQRNVPVYEPSSQRGQVESGQRNVPVYEPNSHRGQDSEWTGFTQTTWRETGQATVPIFQPVPTPNRNQTQTTTWTVSSNTNWPSTSDYSIQQATVHQVPQSNFTIPKNIIDSDSSFTTTIYYAQPVEDSEELFDNVSGGDIPATFSANEVHKQTELLIPGVKTYSQPSVDSNASEKDEESSETYNAPHPSGVELKPNTDSSFSTSTQNEVVTVNISSQNDYDSNLYGGLLPPLPDEPVIPGSKATEKDEESSETYNGPHPYGIEVKPNMDSSFSASTQNEVVTVNISSQNDYDSNLYGGLLPPLPDKSIVPELDPIPTAPTEDRRTNETNIRIFSVYPAPFNFSSVVPLNTSWNEPVYNPPYSSISHSRNWTITNTSKIDALPPTDFWVHSVNNSIIPNPIKVTYTKTIVTNKDPSSVEPIVFSRETTIPQSHTNPYSVPIYSRPTPSQKPPSSDPLQVTTLHTPIYNREYYKPLTHSNDREHTDESMQNLPLSEALKVLLRPYLNRSGTVTDEDVQRTETYIMKIAKPMPTKADGNEKEAELIFTGEQESLSQGARKNHSTNHNHVHQGHHWVGNSQHHSREFHQKHPHIPNPFTSLEEAESDNTKLFVPSRAPDSETISIPDSFDQRFNKETTTPTYYPNRPSVTSQQTGPRFDCRNGKYVSRSEVCDGVNNCGNRMDESYCDHLGYEIRLSNEEGNKHMGRVEVKVLGKWGYVCDDKFGLRDADVLCRELGFPLGASEVRGNSYYPPHVEMMNAENEVRFLMDEVDCKGNETSLRECDFKGWGVHDCTADEVVGVVCKVPVMKCPHDYWLCNASKECIPPAFVCDNVVDCSDHSDESSQVCNSNVEYRLVDGDGRLEGRVEVKYRGVWGTVCDDDFGEVEAQVVCHSLGFYGKGSIVKNAFGAGSGPIWLDQVSCIGNETSIDKCHHWTWGEHNCNHSEDVSIRCSTAPVRAPVTSGVKGRSSKTPEVESSEEVDLYAQHVPRSSRILNNQPKRCGIINLNVTDEFARPEERMQRVVQGSKAKRGHHPWQATIRIKGRSGKSTHWCGAVLISDRHLLTAAHCLAGYTKGAYFVRLGDHYGNIAESSEVDVYIENWYIHENFRKENHMNNDLAIIILKHPVYFNDYVQPICLPPSNATYDDGKTCVISGWGSIQSGISTPANQLRAARIPIISEKVCKQPHVYGNTITDGMFCAGYLDESVDACDGDSGGPLVCTHNDVETLYGIISWGQHCGYANKPGVYVKISHYVDWINEKLGFGSNFRGN